LLQWNNLEISYLHKQQEVVTLLRLNEVGISNNILKIIYGETNVFDTYTQNIIHHEIYT